MIKIINLKVNVKENEENLNKIIAGKLKVEKAMIRDLEIVKKSLDARDKTLYFVYTVAFNIDNEKFYLNKFHKILVKHKQVDYEFKETKLKKDAKIAIVGYGPAGMFSAMNLVEHGYSNVHVFERGERISKRDETVEELFTKAILNENSNVQFGEGGAGTYSDGKLTSRSKDLRSKYVLETLVKFGAQECITYEQLPHIGSDKLKIITTNFTEYLISQGVNFNFSSLVDDFEIIDNKINSITVNNEQINFDHVILAIGHSSRDTFELIVNKGIKCEQKNFAVGMRVEHPQELVNKIMYKEEANNEKLGSASYKLVAKTDINKSVYSFCMCPGGFVVNSSSEKDMLCTNGMSNFSRDEDNANSAILINIDNSDYGLDILDGLNFQRALEKKAFEIGGENYNAPVQNVVDFIQSKSSDSLVIEPSFSNGFKLARLDECFDKYIYDAFVQAIKHFDKILPGFIDKGVFTGFETRSSSPIRIIRTKEGHSETVRNLYPTGEGAGYAGGIISSAIDGVKQAENIMKNSNS